MDNTAIQEIAEELKQAVKPEMKQYKLVIPEPLYQRVQALAERERTTVLDVIRRALKLALIVADLELEPGAELIIRRPGKPDERILFLV